MQLSHVSLAVRCEQQPAAWQTQNNNPNPASHTGVKVDAFQKTSTQKAPQFGCFERFWKRSRNVQDVNAKDANGQTAVARAILKGLDKDSAREIKKLIAQGADVSITDNNGDFPLLTAARLNRVECVRALLNAPTIHINQTTQDGETALRTACLHGCADVVQLLLEKNANPTIANKLLKKPTGTAKNTLVYAQSSGDTRLEQQSTRIIELLTAATPPAASRADDSKRADPYHLRSPL